MSRYRWTTYGSLNYIFAIAYFVVAQPWIVTADDSQPTPCTLIVQDLKQEPSDEWRALGYQVIENKEIASLHPAKIAALLNNSTFIISRAPSRQEFWFSLLNGQSSAQFKPLSFQAPPAKGPVPKNYSCSNMRQRLRFFANTRTAVADSYKLINGRTPTRTRGSLVIDLEYSFLVHHGFTKYSRDKAQAEYHQLLEKVRDIRLEGGADFFSQWAKVRKLIYDKAMTNIEYCLEKGSMIAALLDKCANCMGETYLLQALFDDSGFSPPLDWDSGLQVLNYQDGPDGGSGHVRPVLYNLKTKRLYDLVTGRKARFKGSILKSIGLYEQLWRGHGALRMDDEVLAMKLKQHPYVWMNWGCYNPVAHVPIRLPQQPSDWSTVATCDLYQKGSPTSRADNQFKANPDGGDEDQETQGPSGSNGKTAQAAVDSIDGVNSNDPQGDGPRGERATGRSVGETVTGVGALLLNALGSTVDAIKNGFNGQGSGGGLFGSSGDGFRETPERIEVRDLAKPEVQRELERLAENLIPVEREILRDLIKKGKVTQEAQNAFSESRYTGQLGFAHDNQSISSADLLLPFYVKYSPELNSDGNYNDLITLGGQYSRTRDGQLAVAEFQRCFDVDAALPRCFVTNNKALASEMLSLSGPERLQKLVAVAQEDLRAIAKSVADLVSETHEDPRTILNRLRDDPNAVALLKSFATRLVNYNQIKLNLQRGILLPTGDFENDFDRKETRSVARAFFQAIELRQKAELVATDVINLVFSITEKPIETLRWIDQGLTANKNQVDQTLKNLNEGLSGVLYLVGYKSFDLSQSAVEQKITETFPYKGISGDGFISAVLLLRTLTHPQYFVTVEPERSEVDPYRPYYPLSIHDPRVQDIKVKKGQVMPTEAETYIEVELACDGANDSTIQAHRPRFQVNCKPGIPVKGQGSGHNGQDDIDREGFVSGNADQGVLKEQRPGNYDTFRNGATREENLGTDHSGEILLKRPLTREESRYPTQPGAVEIRHGSLKARKKAKVLNSTDPRPEIFLDPRAWAFLLENTKYHDILAEPLIKLLLHHTFRRKLVPVWRELGVVHFRIFEPADYDPNLLTISYDEVYQLKENYRVHYGYQYDHNSYNLTADSFHHLRRSNAKLFMGFEDRPFVKLAVSEILTRLKPGYLLLKREGLFKTKNMNLKSLVSAFKLKGSVPALGITLPYLCQVDENASRAKILLGARDDSNRCYTKAELQSVQNEPNDGNFQSQDLISEIENSAQIKLAFSDEQNQEITGIIVQRGSFSLNRRAIFTPLKEGSASNDMSVTDFETMIEEFGVNRRSKRRHDGNSNYYDDPYRDSYPGHF